MAGNQARVLCDMHLHTHHSWDCTTTVDELVERALARGLGAIAVTDHNTIAGGIEAAQHVGARGLPLQVIVGSEIKTASEGEVIGLFLTDEIPAGLSFAETVAAIRGQGGLVSIPHPFDRLHTTPPEALLERSLNAIDVFETCNARLYFEADNRSAAAFAERHGLRVGAGSDAHVPEGVGTGAIRVAPFEGAASFLAALEGGEIVRQPRSLLALQARKWRRQRAKRSAGG
jgi:predicted metal-dependent phosphoesterase TrpH